MALPLGKVKGFPPGKCFRKQQYLCPDRQSSSPALR